MRVRACACVRECACVRACVRARAGVCVGGGARTCVCESSSPSSCAVCYHKLFGTGIAPLEIDLTKTY